MHQAGTMERPARQRGRGASARVARPTGSAERTATPRPVTDRVAQYEIARRRAAEGIVLPDAVLTLTQRTGSHPWRAAILAAGAGLLGAALQQLVPWAPFALVTLVVAGAVGVVAGAVLVRRKARAGGLLRPQELVIDTDQAIPAAMFAPVGALVGWVAGTLLF